MAKQIVKNTFETIEEIAKGVAQDAKQSITGEYPNPESQNQVLASEQKQDIKKQETQKAQQIRQNIAQINQQIAEARKRREQKVVQEEHKEVQKKQEKMFEKKKKESILEKIIKSQQGSKESSQQRVSG